MSKAIWWAIVIPGCGLFAAIIVNALPKTETAPVKLVQPKVLYLYADAARVKAKQTKYSTRRKST